MWWFMIFFFSYNKLTLIALEFKSVVHSTHGCKGKIRVSLYWLFNEQLANSDSTKIIILYIIIKYIIFILISICKKLQI